MIRTYEDCRTITDDYITLVKGKCPNGFSGSDTLALKAFDGNYFEALEIKSPERGVHHQGQSGSS